MPDIHLDQAAGLRRLSTPRSVKVVAVTGGKGGVGKTLTAVNLGAALAGLGRSTMLLDADFGLANVDVLLGMKARLNLEHVVSGQCALEDVILTSTVGPAGRACDFGQRQHGDVEPCATRGSHRRFQPAARAARRAPRRYGRGLERRRHHFQRSRAARGGARVRRACVADRCLRAHQGLEPAAAELPVRSRGQHGRLASPRARALREAHARVPSVPRHYAVVLRLPTERRVRAASHSPPSDRRRSVPE